MLKVANSIINASQIATPITLPGDVTLSTGNLVIGTSGKGIDFSVTTSGSGTMTSELLADYEEGTWTPNQGAGLVLVGAFSSSGTYIKVGNVVTIQAKLAGATSISWASGAVVLFTNLPFNSMSGFEFTGHGHNSGYTTSFSVTTAATLAQTLNVYSIEAQTAVADVYITLTYFV